MSKEQQKPQAEEKHVTESTDDGILYNLEFDGILGRSAPGYYPTKPTTSQGSTEQTPADQSPNQDESK